MPTAQQASFRLTLARADQCPGPVAQTLDTQGPLQQPSLVHLVASGHLVPAPSSAAHRTRSLLTQFLPRSGPAEPGSCGLDCPETEQVTLLPRGSCSARPHAHEHRAWLGLGDHDRSKTSPPASSPSCSLWPEAHRPRPRGPWEEPTPCPPQLQTCSAPASKWEAERCTREPRLQSGAGTHTGVTEGSREPAKAEHTRAQATLTGPSSQPPANPRPQACPQTHLVPTWQDQASLTSAQPTGPLGGRGLHTYPSRDGHKAPERPAAQMQSL